MSVDLAVSAKAPVLQIELDNDMQYGLGRYCERFGRRPMTQAGLKCLQAIPIAHAALAVKESAKMSAATRNVAMSRCYQEISAPGWIKVLELAEGQGFRFPGDYKDRLYYTTLGTGKRAPQTFMQKPEVLYQKFSSLKTEYTKGPQLWFATHQDIAADLPSGTNTQDALELMEKALYLKSDRYKKEGEDASLEADINDLFAPVSAAAPTGGALPTPAASAALATDLSTGVGEPGGGEPGVGEPGAGEPGTGDSDAGEPGVEKPEDVEIPDDYIYTWILLACAWAPWGGNTPSEWKHLMSSSGPKKRKKPEEDIVLDEENPVTSPSAMGRVNANGDPASRRQHLAAVKKEKNRAQKEESDKENKEVRREALKTSRESVETRKASLAVLAKASSHVETIGLNLQRMVEQADAKAATEARAAKIAALEKKLMLGIGNANDVRTQLGSLLDQEG